MTRHQPPNFDPRTVPVAGTDAHLPAVRARELTAAALRERFASPPAWEPEARTEPVWQPTGRPLAAAAVLVPIVLRPVRVVDGSKTGDAAAVVPSVLLTERSTHLSTHSGQVAFPGGRADPEDRDLVDTALREAEEEIGLSRSRVEVLGMLPTYTTGSGFVITPVIGLLQPTFTLTLNRAEVADAFEVPLEFLMNPAHHRRHRADWNGTVREWWSMPYVDAYAGEVDSMDGEDAQPPLGRNRMTPIGTDRRSPIGVERFVWGATAGMLRNLYRFLAAA